MEVQLQNELHSQNLLEKELQPGETVKWSGRADPAFSWDLVNIGRLAFAAVLLLSLLTAPGVLTGHRQKPGILPFEGPALVVYGLAWLLAIYFIARVTVYPLLAERRLQRETIYGVTDKRILIIRPGKHGVLSADLASMPGLDKQINPYTGQGRISFGIDAPGADDEPMMDDSGFREISRKLGTVRVPTAFENITNAEEAYQMITSLREQATAANKNPLP